MKIISPSTTILTAIDTNSVYAHLENAYRLCYKSEDKIKSNKDTKSFLTKMLASHHVTPIEHFQISVRIICDRGVSHELVRHRLTAVSQESTRYCNYAKNKYNNEITVIKPFFWQESSDNYAIWQIAMQDAEDAYLSLLAYNTSAQQARLVLPNSLKTEIMMSANIREWLHIFELRCSKASHPQMREIMLPLLKSMWLKLPVLFDQVYNIYKVDILTSEKEDNFF